MNYKWNILKKSESIKDVLNGILEYKNISKDDVKDFIDCNTKLHDPFLLTNMNKAVQRLNIAKEKNERIMIIGDYDCDGVTSIVVLYIGLRYMGFNVVWEVPDRFKDGYGLNNRLIDEAKLNECTLILTADNGIAAHEQVKYANSLGIEVIVTDHHELLSKELPTEIVVDPKIDDNYPFKGICGCMVAFKLLNALDPELYKNEYVYEELCSFTTIGTIADVMDLLDENRGFVKEGLKYISRTKNRGLMTLLKAMNLYEKEITTTNIAFSIGPAINVAGRLDSPKLAINLFLCDDDVIANKLAKKLIDLNKERKMLQEEIVQGLEIKDTDGFIIVNAENVSHGIIGIIAGKISEKYQRPCFVLSGKNGKLSGSGRSIMDYDISDIIVKNPDVVGGGGHAGACGVKLEEHNLELLKDICNKHFKRWLESKENIDLTPTIDIISEVPFSIVDQRLINNINKLQPFGQGNPEPLFVTKNVFVSNYKIVGENKNAIQFTFDDDTNILKGIAFNNGAEIYKELNYPKYVDIAYSIGLNEWPAGQFNVQLIIKDIKISEKNI